MTTGSSQIPLPIFCEIPKILGKSVSPTFLYPAKPQILKPAPAAGFIDSPKHEKKIWHAGWLMGKAKSKNMNRVITKKDFRKEVISSTGLSLVQFKKEWNGACQIILPIYEELARSYKGQANFFTVDVEREPGIEREYGVTEIPTILFFRNGEII